MEIDILRTAWNEAVPLERHLPKEKLADMLDAKVRSVIRRFVVVTGISVLTSIVVLAFLVFAAISRKEDMLYGVNNALLAFITLGSLLSAVYSMVRLNDRENSMSLKEYVEREVKLISGSLYGRYSRVYLIVIPVTFILLLFSINIYFGNRSMAEVLSSEEGISALMAGFVIGLPVSFFVYKRLRRYHIGNLEKLKDLQKQIKGGQ
jgi:hypothetical protein